MTRPRMSVVVPVHNCRKTIAKCLDALGSLDHSSYEVIIVDDGSTDDTASVAESFEWCTVIRLDKGGPSRARNVGIAAAKGDFVAFTDGDCRVDPRWLIELEKGFVAEEIAGVGGDQRSPNDETPTGRLVQEFFRSVGFMTGYITTSRQQRDTDHNPSCCSAYRKTVLDEVGGFDEQLWPGEDVDLDYRIRRKGYRLVFNPRAMVAHYRPKTIRGLVRMMGRYGACQWPLVKRYGLFRKLHYEPIALMAAFILAGVLLWHDPRLWPVLLLPFPAIFLWFFGKTKSFKKAFQFSYMLIVTVVAWNWGFFGAVFSCSSSKWPVRLRESKNS
ncbi:MAG: glycosyltransferase [Desulfomonile sp.]|nr:glycosyltransferase [Desulfomonile sp.]